MTMIKSQVTSCFRFEQNSNILETFSDSLLGNDVVSKHC